MPLCLALPLFVFPREETLPLTFFCSEISQAYIIIKSVRRSEGYQVFAYNYRDDLRAQWDDSSLDNAPPLSTPQLRAFLTSVFKILKPLSSKGDRY